MTLIVNLITTILPAFACLAFGVYALSANAKDIKHQVFFGYNLIVAFVAFFEYEFRMASDLEEAQFWLSLQTIWPLMAAAPLHFSLLVSKPERKARFRDAVFIYGTALIICVIISIPGLYQNSPQQSYFGWHSVYNMGLLSVAIMVWALVIALFAIALPYRAHKREKRYILQRQQQVIAYAYAIGYAIGLSSGLLIPLLGLSILELDKLGIMFSNLIILIAITKYGLFEYDAKSIAENVIRFIPEALFVTDVKGIVQLTNNASLDYLRLSRSDVVGHDVSEFFGNKMIEPTGEGKEGCDDLLLARDAKPVPIYRTARLIYDNDVYRGMLVLATDVSELKRFERQLVVARDQAEESDRLKSVFLANISHEIRTPMNAILGFTQLLTTGAVVGEKQLKYVNLITKNVHNLLHIIDDLMEISKLESMRTKVNRQPFSVRAMFEQLHDVFETIAATNKKTHLSFGSRVVDDEFESIVADKSIILKVLTKLIENSVKFTDEGKIEVGYQVLEDTLAIFYIKDTGIGIPKDKCSVIFEPFRQSEDSYSRKFGGTGVSLTIAKRYVELLGGKIWVESENQEGAVFYFSVPIWSR